MPQRRSTFRARLILCQVFLVFRCLSVSFIFSRLPALEMQVLGLYCFNDTGFPFLRVRSIKMKTPKATGGGLDMSLQTSFNLGLLSQVKVSDVAKRY